MHKLKEEEEKKKQPTLHHTSYTKAQPRNQKKKKQEGEKKVSAPCFLLSFQMSADYVQSMTDIKPPPYS